jgi:hypothetical protein
MTQFKINTNKTDSIYDEFRYCATFDDYDGTPIDHETPSPDKIGYGETEHEAMFDLLEKSL